MRLAIGTWVSVLSIVLASGCANEDESEGGNPSGVRSVVILHTNDEHSHMLGFGPNSEYPYLPVFDAAGNVDTTATGGSIAMKLAQHYDTQTVGGLARRLYLVNKIRNESADPVLLLSGGDSMMGTLFTLATPDAAPDFVAMGLLGYDFTTIGNHDFDWGTGLFTQAIRVEHETLQGASVPIIASNIHFDNVGDDATAQALEALYGPGDSGADIMPWATKELDNGLKVGFLGLLGYSAAQVAPNASPIAFTPPTSGAPCTATCSTGFSCENGYCVDPTAVADTQALVDKLRNVEKVDLVILLSHQGVAEDAALATNVDGIDVIIGGHSHDEEAPTRVNGTIIVQAGSYGTKLGKLVVEVDHEGNVTYDADESGLLPVDHTLDEEIYGDTDLLAQPPVISGGIQTATAVTAMLVGPVMEGLNEELMPALNAVGLATGDSILDPVVSSDHDIVGEHPHQDSNLSHFVTDAERAVVLGGMEFTNPYVVAVQANGIIRESLRFGKPEGTSGPTASLADLFRVVPLGASPFDGGASPGYPMIVFSLDPVSLYGGLDMGVTKGLVADDYFLSYAGMKVSYDPTAAPFDAAAFLANPLGYRGGRITSIDIWNNVGQSYDRVFEYDPNGAAPWVAGWGGLDLTNARIVVISNLYLGAFLEQFNVEPHDALTGATIVPDPDLAMPVLGQTVLCTTGTTIVRCYDLPGNQAPWIAPEIKEWTALLQYIDALGGVIPPTMYAEPLTDPRVSPVE